MQLSYRWLSSLVDLHDVSPQMLAERLAAVGIEVESIDPLTVASQITTGLVLEKKHIDQSHLSHVYVDTGQHGKRWIVCGAANIDVGQKVIVALPGAVLKALTIKSSTIRGALSDGMVCALNELGIPTKCLAPSQVEGIEVLPPSTPIGDDSILQTLGYDDWILDIKLLANRPDLLAMEYFALEVAAIFNRPLLPQATVTLDVPKQDATFSLDVKTPLTRQFSFAVLRNIEQKQTPQWMKSRLMASGMRPLSFLVDVGNYMMLLTGQPMHFYDVDKMPAQSLTVQTQYGKPFIALDGKNYDLLADDIVIQSNDDVMCLAGVMGAKVCAVDEQTTSIGIEVAAFDAASVRRTAMRLNLISESSQRFAKGIALHRYEDVLTRTIALIHQLSPIGYVEATIQVGQEKPYDHAIAFEPHKINALLSTQFSEAVMISTLKRLGIHIENQQAIIPSHRKDMEFSADLAEELIRLLGFDSITSAPLSLPIMTGGLSLHQQKVKHVKQLAASLGYQEVLTYTLVDHLKQSQVHFLSPLTPHQLMNPLSDQRKHVRTSLLNSVLEVALYNQDHQLTQGQFYEIASTYGLEGQRVELAAVSFGHKLKRSSIEGETYSVFDGKALVDQIFKHFHIDRSRYTIDRFDKAVDVLHPGRSMTYSLQGEVVAIVGELTPPFKAAYGFGKQPVIIVHVDLAGLLALPSRPLKATAIAKYPSVIRDLTYIVPSAITFEMLQKAIKKAGKSRVETVELFDIFHAESMGKDVRSLTLRMRLVDQSRTLDETLILETMASIERALEDQFQLVVRR